LNQLLIILLSSIILFACVSAPPENTGKDAPLKQFTVDPDKAGVFVYNNEKVPAGLKTEIALDGTPVGFISGMQYLYVPVAAGQHSISSRADTTDIIDFEAAAGSLVYVRQDVEVEADKHEVDSGEFAQRVKLELKSQLIGKTDIQGCSHGISKLGLQTIDVELVTDDPAWAGPLECQASNPFGAWEFIAPGKVTLHPSVVPLKITCNVPQGAGMDESATSANVPKSQAEIRRKASTQGAKAGSAVGAGIGVGAGIASVPVMGTGLAAVLVLGVALQGAEIGGLIGALTANESGALTYPSPITIHIKRVSSLQK